jgi:uncharacterized protein
MRHWRASRQPSIAPRSPPELLFLKCLVDGGAYTTSVEIYSAYARLRRAGTLSRAGEEEFHSLLSELSTEWTEIEPSPRVRQHAERLLFRHSLRAADALQLGAALVWADGPPMDHDFVCIDERLREAAAGEGFRIHPQR